MVRKLARLFTLAASCLFLTACGAAISLLNLATPTEGYTVTKDVPYGADGRQKLDIYVPTQREPQNTVLVFFYGGSWQWGDKNDYLFVGQAFAALGYVTVIADYRVYPAASFPAFIDDAAAVTAWAHANAATYGGDPNRLFVAGHSAGGYLATMLAANPLYMKKAGGDTRWLRGAIGIAAPLDFLPLTDKNLIALFSTAPHITDTQPITFARAGMPPVLLAHGTDDETVLPRNSINMAAHMKALGNDVTLREYAGVNHYTIALSIARHFQSKSPLMADIKAFIDSH